MRHLRLVRPHDPPEHFNCRCVMEVEMIPDSFFNVVAQLSHVGWGALVITWTALLFPREFYWIWVALESVAAIKEFWYDQNYETADERGSNLLDFSMYTLGALLAFGALLLKGIL